MTLRDVKVDQTVSVVKLHGEGATKRRIMDTCHYSKIRLPASDSRHTHAS